MPQNILILDCTNADYNGASIDQSPTGGIALVTVRLAEQLATVGMNVCVRNHTCVPITHKNVRWENVSSLKELARPDIILASNDVNLFAPYDEWIRQGSRPILWIHNLVTWKRIFKKHRLGNLIKYRPESVFLSEYHLKSCAPFVPLGRKYIIPHAVDDGFFDVEGAGRSGVQSRAQKLPQALFLSKAFRGFGAVLKLWMRDIHPHAPRAMLRAYIGRDELPNLGVSEDDLRTHNIHILDRAPQKILRDEMAASSCLIYPGHKDETFCNVAAESTVLGLPIVTMGIGALNERARNGAGIVAKTDQDLAKIMVDLFQNPLKIQQLSQNALAAREQYRWSTRIKDWMELFQQSR
ncbi:MAG: glycosyltransferase family 4 protein [Alphaproteobacteria bacterium]|nr:glycosyltransferase family 4 protein [Alphaproteobacteria bacterium]